MYSIGSNCQKYGARGRIVARKAGLIGNPGSAERLGRLMNDAQRHTRGGYLHYGDLGPARYRSIQV